MKFRTYDRERLQIAERNRRQTLFILKEAGIDKNHPYFMRYYRATIKNVHNAYRFSYRGETQEQLDAVFESFVSAIQTFPLKLYEQQTQEFLYMRAQKQLEEAAGDFAEESTYEEMRQTLNKTIQTGLKIRKRKKTRFPKEFYDQNKNLQRLIYEMDDSDQNIAAMANIERYTKKYDHVSFDTQKNRFIVSGIEVGPQKFFTSRAQKIEKFFQKAASKQTAFDTTDTELLNILIQGDFKTFLNLRKTRALASDKQNEDLRTALNDEIIFCELSDIFKNREQLTYETLQDCLQHLQNRFQKSAELVQRESQKDVLGRIDRIMFSPIPEDVATQSTFKDWQSCMHASAVWHDRVPHAIGLGAIVAYGYDSKNPSKIISRILINPYHTKFSKKVAYRAANRIYGLENSAFRDVVERVTEYFNTNKSGVFYRDDELYRDDKVASFVLFKIKNGILDLRKIKPNAFGQIELDTIKLPKARGVLVARNRQLSLRDITIPEGFDLSNIQNLEFKRSVQIEKNVKLPQKVDCEIVQLSGYLPAGTDFSNAQGLSLIHTVHVGPKVRFPSDINTRNIHILDNSDLSSAQNLTAEAKFKAGKNVVFPKTVNLMRLEIGEDTDLSSVENLILVGQTHFSKNVTLPQNVTLGTHQMGGYIPQNLDLSKLSHVEFSENLRFLPKSIKLPEHVFITTIPEATDLSKVAFLHIKDNAYIGKNVKLPQNFSIKDRIAGYIPDNLDLSGKAELVFGPSRGPSSFLHIGQNVKLPETIQIHNVTVGEGSNFKSAKNAILTGHIKISNNVTFPGYVEIADAVIEDNSDLSHIKNLVIGGRVRIGKNVKLPKSVKFDNLKKYKNYSYIHVLSGYIPDNADLTAWHDLGLTGNLFVGKNVKFSDHVHIRNADIIDGADFSNIEHLYISGTIKTNGTVTFPKTVRAKEAWDTRHFVDNGATELELIIKGDSDLSSIDCLKVSNAFTLNIEDHVKLPKQIAGNPSKISGKIPDHTDLSNRTNILVIQNAEIGKNVKFPPDVKMEHVVFKDITPDFSKVKNITLSEMNLKNYNISFPKKSKVCIDSGVCFDDDYVLDLSKCREARVLPSVKCKEVKLPKTSAIESSSHKVLPKQVKEVSTLYIMSSPSIFIPAKTKIIDDPDKNGNLVSLNTLQKKGVSVFHLFKLYKARALNRLKSKIHQAQTNQSKANRLPPALSRKNTHER